MHRRIGSMSSRLLDTTILQVLRYSTTFNYVAYLMELNMVISKGALLQRASPGLEEKKKL